MKDEDFRDLIMQDGPLAHPDDFQRSFVLMNALKAVLDATGSVGEEALHQHILKQIEKGQQWRVDHPEEGELL